MSDDRLSDDEAARVFRRATEIDVDLAHRAEGWDVGQLEAVGREVGITPEAVRRAVAEVRLGPPPVPLDGPVVRRWRVVPATPAIAQAELATWLHDQLFEPVRDRPGEAVFDARSDADAARRRQRDATANRLRLKAVRRVAIAAGSAPGGGAVVRVEAELAGSRTRLAFGPGVGVGAATWAAGALAPLPAGLLWLGVPAAAAGAGWGWWRAGIGLRRASTDVGLALDGALDRLER